MSSARQVPMSTAHTLRKLQPNWDQVEAVKRFLAGDLSEDTLALAKGQKPSAQDVVVANAFHADEAGNAAANGQPSTGEKVIFTLPKFSCKPYS